VSVAQRAIEPLQEIPALGEALPLVLGDDERNVSSFFTVSGNGAQFAGSIPGPASPAPPALKFMATKGGR